jgi:hypothetical protein
MMMSPPNERLSKELGSLKADWIARVVRDPSQPANATTLTGYLGDSAKDGHARLYFDVDLSSYVDIPADDLLHAQRLPQDQSPLGEVIVWIRRTAKLVQGTEGAQAAGSWFEGPIVQEQYGTAAVPNAIGGITPVLTAPIRTFPIWNCPPRTLPWNGCPPPTLPWQGCPPVTVPWQGCPPLTQTCPRTPIKPCITNTLIGPGCNIKTPIVLCATQNLACSTAICPVTRQVNCVSNLCPVTLTGGCQTNFCPQSQAIVCTGACPSIVDGCPSAPGGCDWTTVINPGTTVVNPGGVAINPGAFGGNMFG